MTETLFAFDERNYQDCQSAFRGHRNQEYYLGDYSIEPGAVIDVRADRKGVGSCSIVRLTSRSRLFFRRSWPHIREDGVDVTVLWFVKRGRLCISHQTGYTIAKEGEFAITKSTTPFFVECQPDDEGVHEVLHVVAPSHVLRRHIPQDLRAGFSSPTDRREFEIAERMLLDVFEDNGGLTEEVGQLLLGSALSVLGHAMRDCGPVRQSVSDKRFQDVLREIDVHLSDPALSIATVAKGCGISPRYLSFLLKLHGTTFSTLVWDKRLNLARRWLSSAKSGEVSISEVAYSVGFKSPAHFSRMFKRQFNVNPREFRSVARSDDGEPAFVDDDAALAR